MYQFWPKSTSVYILYDIENTVSWKKLFFQETVFSMSIKLILGNLFQVIPKKLKAIFTIYNNNWNQYIYVFINVIPDMNHKTHLQPNNKYTNKISYISIQKLI